MGRRRGADAEHRAGNRQRGERGRGDPDGADLLLRGTPDSLPGRGRIHVPGKGHDPAETNSRQLPHDRRHFRRRDGARLGPQAPGAGVHLPQQPEVAVGALARLIYRNRRGGVVHDGADPCPPRQGKQPLYAPAVDGRVCHQQLRRADVRHGLRLRNGRGGEAGRAGGKLKPGYLLRLVGLHVRPQAHPGGSRPGGHLSDVRLQHGGVHDQGRVGTSGERSKAGIGDAAAMAEGSALMSPAIRRDRPKGSWPARTERRRGLPGTPGCRVCRRTARRRRPGPDGPGVGSGPGQRGGPDRGCRPGRGRAAATRSPGRGSGRSW